VDRVIDIDEAALVLREEAAKWATAGMSVGRLTWRDANAGWPQPILEDRRAVEDAESVGVWAKSADENVEIQVVIWRGGWADADAVDLKTGEVLQPREANELTGIEDCRHMLDVLTAWVIPRLSL
jgi:hypothetical protein